MTEATDQKPVTEIDDRELDTKITEISQKPEKTDDDNKQLEGLKGEKQTRYQKRVDQLTWKAKHAEEQSAEKDKRIAELEAAKVEPAETQPATIKKDSIEIDGKKHFTDEALMSMRDAGELTDAEAYKMQRNRDKAELKHELKTDFETEQQQSADANARRADGEKVLKEYPQFDKNHAEHNPEDPLYKEASRIYANGYSANPNGFSLAIKDAKAILGLDKKAPDVTNDLNVYSPSAPEGPTTKETPLNDDEKEAAIRQFVHAAEINPVTNRTYTESEAIAKSQKAKNNRASRRIT